MLFSKATETNMPRLTGCRAINVIVCKNRHRRDENYAARWGKYAIDVRKIEIINQPIFAKFCRNGLVYRTGSSCD